MRKILQNLLNLHRRRRRGASSPTEMPPTIEMITANPMVASVSVFFAFSRTTVINNIDMDNQGARAPSIQNFTNQFK